MLNYEQTQILEQAIFLLFRLRNEQSIENWERERARQFGELHRPIINLKEIDSKEITNDEENGGTPLSDKDFKGFLKFTEKEILKMPKPFRKIFRVDGNKAHVRKRADGRYKCSFEIRYAKKPYNKHPISASGATLEIAKARFIEKLNNYIPQDDTAPTVPKDFHGFALYWFENFHKRKVAENTFKKDFTAYHKYIENVFKNDKLSEITPVKVQKILDSYSDKERTKETIHSLLNQTFKCAVKHGLLKLNPIDMCFYQKHEREHGVAISKADERKLLTAYKDTVFELDFAILLYTGLRPCEYKSVVLLERFIRAQNCKRKGGKIEFKQIPISPMLKPYVDGLTEIKLHCPSAIDRRLKAVLPKHTLKDMRTTFQTRLDECEIPDKIIGLVMGNTIGKGDRIKETYTDVKSEEYQAYIYEWLQRFIY